MVLPVSHHSHLRLGMDRCDTKPSLNQRRCYGNEIDCHCFPRLALHTRSRTRAQIFSAVLTPYPSILVMCPPTLEASWRFRESRRVVAYSRVPQLDSHGSAERDERRKQWKALICKRVLYSASLVKGRSRIFPPVMLDAYCSKPRAASLSGSRA